MRKKRHNYTPEEKVIILKRHLIERVPISDLCDDITFSRRSFTSGNSSSLKTTHPPN
jgi:hypothetical protein